MSPGPADAGPAGSPGPAFLSPEWLDRLSAVLAAVPVPGDLPALALGVVVSHVPPDDGTVSYVVRLGGEQPASVVSGTDDRPDVVLAEEYEDARALANGTVSAAELLTAGRIKLRGDVSKLVRSAELFAALSAAMAAARPDAGTP